MNIYRFSLLLIITFLGYNSGSAQPPAHVPDEVLVSLHPGLRPETLIRRMENQFPLSPVSALKISNLLNVWLLKSDISDQPNTIDWLQRQPEVFVAQNNFVVDNRFGNPNNLLPNDPLFPQQWQYINSGANNGVPNADLDADLAWEITTGGLTPAGDTIVIAVIDGGIDQNHNDLAGMLWKNWGEIPNDNIDNDNNGFVDDFRGWNVWEGNDNIAGISAGHGTPVGTIIGAKGNNGIGVTGINWNIKTMFVVGGGSQANILAAYDYVLQSRRQYNASNGQKGAFIVAVNCSWGTDYGQPAEAPLWCAAFDSLGLEGILSIAATANNPVDVDESGDLPTTCPSEYLVAVTSLNHADIKAADAAWGMTHVDLGAYGQGVYTAGANNSYGKYYGTSFAAPQVSGAVGLLYSSPCPNLIALAKSDPAAAAAWTKTLLLNSTVPNSSMQGITATGGRLNLYTLLQDYEDQCSPCPAPFALMTSNITSNSVLLKWSEISGFQSVMLHWRAFGSGTWNAVSNVQNNYLLENLNPCTTYEFSLSALCAQGISSDWSQPVGFKTDGCCEPPNSIWTTAINSTEVSIAWNTVAAANGYKVRIRPVSGNWQTLDANTSAFLLQNLLPCTNYETAVQTLCDTGATAFSNSLFFKTAGCGSCTDAQYCTAKSENAGDEWINLVSIGDWAHDSGNSGGGYQNFTGPAFTDVPKLFPQTPEDVAIVPGFQGIPYKEFFRIFIDYNMDGDFADTGELAFDPVWASENPVYGQITPPLFLSEGMTRMRVMMKYKGPGDSPPTACETFEFGQVEDYCVELSLGANVETESTDRQETMLHIFPIPAGEAVWLNFSGETDNAWHVSVWDMTGKRMSSGMKISTNNQIQVRTADWPAGIYVVELSQGQTVRRGKILKQ